MPKVQKARMDMEAQKAAYLCAVHGLTQDEIGRVLGGVSQSRVSRLLKRAEGGGWLQRSYKFASEGLSPSRMTQLRTMVESGTLVARLEGLESETGVRVRRAHVVDSGSASTGKAGWSKRLVRFGNGAAVILAALLKDSDVLAVTWGGTVSHVVDGLMAIQTPARGRAIRFVPVCGEPVEVASNRDTSSHVAERLHQSVSSTAAAPPSLTGVPALIPRHYRSADEKAIRKFVEHSGSYREVFGTKSPLINRVDSLLTSAGPSAHPMGFIHEELLSAGSTRFKKLTRERLSRLVVGDLGGVLIPRRGLSASDRREVDRLRDMWTGAKLSHFERIARRAARSSIRPGVILVAMGVDRADVVAAAIRWGLVNELIIDRALADELTRQLDAAS